MFGHITHKIFNKPLQKKTEQHESVQIIDAEGSTNAVYLDDGKRTWVSPLQYPTFERRLMEAARKRAKVDNQTDAHIAAKHKLKAICKHQQIKHSKIITVFKVNEMIDMLKNIETFDASRTLLAASAKFALSGKAQDKQQFINHLIYFRGNEKDGQFWRRLNNRKKDILREVEQRRESLLKEHSPLLHLTRTIRYFKALQRHFQRDEAEKKSKEDIAYQCAKLLGVQEYVKDVVRGAQHTDYNLKDGYEVSGVSIATIGREIAYGLKAACLVFDIESTNEAIEHAHDAVRLRSIKKSANTNRKQTTKWKRDKKLSDFLRQMMKYDVPTSVQLKTTLKNGGISNIIKLQGATCLLRLFAKR